MGKNSNSVQPEVEQKPEDVSPENIQEALAQLLAALGPITGDVVNLDLFTGKDIVYHVADIRGEEREFPIPVDPPFETALAFFDAHDGYEVANVELAEAAAALNRAEKPAEIARLRAREQSRKAAYVRARAQVLAAFLRLVQIRRPDMSLEELSPGTGHAALDNWMKVAIFRLNEGRISAAIHSAGLPKEPDPPNRASQRQAARAR